MVINANDPRGPKAVAIATDAGQWLKCRTADGRKAYGIRSSTDANHVYLVGRNFCTCPARMHAPGRDCKHMIAVALHVEYVGEMKAERHLCGAPHPTRDAKVCGNPFNHYGDHAWVFRTERED